jgi:hypothetical protein
MTFNQTQASIENLEHFVAQSHDYLATAQTKMERAVKFDQRIGYETFDKLATFQAEFNLAMEIASILDSEKVGPQQLPATPELRLAAVKGVLLNRLVTFRGGSSTNDFDRALILRDHMAHVKVLRIIEQGF